MIQRSIQKKRAGEGGFTLVELLIVIVILGILAAIVVLAIGGLQGTAKTANCNAGTKTIESAEDAYFAQNNAYGTGAQLWSGGAAATKLLKTDPTPTFTVTAPTTQTYLIHGVGDCSAMADVTGP
jgi:prepilin-type N-terminal cleavage/methylation domain-containing protein